MSSYDPLPLLSTVSSGSSVPRRPSGSYPHSYDRPMTSSSHPRANSSPDSRRPSSSGYDSYKSANYDMYRGSEYSSYGDYRHSGGYDRYRDPPENNWDQSRSSHPSRDYYNVRHTASPVSPNPNTIMNRDRDKTRARRDSVSMKATRMFEPNNSWKQANGHENSELYSSVPSNYEFNGTHRRDSRDQDNFSGKASWSQSSYYRTPSSSSRDQRPSDSRDRYSYKLAYKDDDRDRSREHDSKTDGRSSDHYIPYTNGPSRNGRRSPSRGRSESRSPRRLGSQTRSQTPSRSPSRSRSRSRSHSRSRSSVSRSGSSTRSVSRSPSKTSRLPQRSSGKDQSTYNARGSLSSWSRDRSERAQRNYSTYRPSRRSTSPKGKSARRHVDSSYESASSVSRSPSRSSIASSREPSVKPPPTRPNSDTKQSSSSDDQPSHKLTVTTTEPHNVELSSAPPQPPENVHKPSDSNLAPSSAPVTVTDSPEQNYEAVQKQVAEKDPLLLDGHLMVSASFEPSESAPMSKPVAMEPEPARGSENEVQLDRSSQLGNTTRSTDSSSRPSPEITFSRPRAVHAPTVPDLRPEDIPKMSDATNLPDALRVVVMTRLLAERQTRQELVEPVLVSNIALSTGLFPDSTPGTSPEVLIDEMTSPDSERVQARMRKFNKMKNSLIEEFEARQVTLKDKVQRLTDEYLTLHEKWVAHCTQLDEQAKTKANTLFATVGTVPVAPPPPITGRTTRRSAATLGDAVRSDFEMEQIIASLGYDEATDPNQLAGRNVATIPDMISVSKGKVDYVYDDNNLLVKDPVTYYAPHTGIHDWTEEEKQLFLDKFAAHPKQFGAIAKHLPNKTTAQCVDFYYLHKKLTIDFRKVVAMKAPGRKGRRGRAGKGKGNALLTDIIQHDAEVSNNPGGPITVAAPRARGKRGGASGGIVNSEPRRSFVRKPASAVLDSTPTTATPTPEPETRPRRRRAVLNSRFLLSAQIDIDDDLDDLDDRPTKRAKRVRKVKSAAIVDDDGMDSSSTPPPVSIDLDQGDLSSRRPTPDQWSDEDKELFLKLLGQHGDNFKRIAASMPSKTMTQVNNYYKANRIELDLDKIVDAAPKRSVSPAESDPHKAADSSVPVAASTPDSVERTPPMASLTPDDLPASSGPTPQSNSTRDHTNNATHPTVPSVHEMYAVYPDAHRFPRYTTSVTSPYGAMPMSPIYTGMIGGIPPGTPYTGLASPAGYRPSAGTPPLGAVPPAAAMNGYPPNAYGGGSHYVPYTYPYQQGPSYPPPPYVPPRPASSASPVPSNNAVNPYAHSIPDPTMRSYYPYS